MMKIYDYHLIWILCTIGCVAQLYSVTYQFVNFGVRSSVSFDYPRTVELPDIDIMIPMALAINLTEIFSRYPMYMNTICQIMQSNTSFNITSNNFEVFCPRLRHAPIILSRQLSYVLTVKDIEQLTIKAVRNITEIMVLETKNGLLTQGFCKTNQFFSSDAIYLRISCRNQSKPFIVDVRKYLVSGNHFGIMAHNSGQYFGFRFAAPDAPCEINPSRYFTITKATKDLMLTSVRYKKIVTLSLKNPYQTSCKNYHKSSTLWNCLLSRSTNKEENSYLPENVLISYGQYPGHLGFRENKEMSFCADVIDRPECETVLYETEGNNVHEQMSYDAGLIYLEPPLDPIVYYKTYPAFPLSDYMIFVGSILGIWFGISIAERLSSGVKYLRTIRAKYRRKLSKNSNNSIQDIYWMERIKIFY